VAARVRSFPRLALAGLAAGVLVVAAGGIVLGLWLTGPSWPHPWCVQVMKTLYANGQTYGAFTNALQYAENAGAPTGQLLSDENSLASDIANVNSSDISSGITYMQAESTDLASVKADAQQLNTACGKPASHQIGQLGVPPSS
jgi:hypothetical protein